VAFIYDLSSAHGTFLNKKKIEERKYIRLHVGDQLRFGASSRLYLLQGPPVSDDVEERNVAAILHQRKMHESDREKTLEMSWGFKQDAYEGDEWGGVDVKSSIDRSLISPEQAYCSDPKKALALFVENNGAESSTSYPKEEGGMVTARIEITGLQGPLFATGMGRRKGQAEKDACLEACYKLDLLGILYEQRGSATDRVKRLREEIEEDEQDNYLDKTVERKGKYVITY
jgi:hypothetical protein